MVDVVLGVVAAQVAVALTHDWSRTAGVPRSGWVVAAAAVHGGVVLLRRAAPSVVLGVALLTAAVYVVLGFPVFMLGPAMLVVLYTVASHDHPPRSVIGLGAAEVTLLVLMAWGPTEPGIDTTVLFAGLLAGAWSLGEVVRRAREAAEAHARRAEELERAREELARYAVTTERLRIARELHDIVAHNMSIVSLHAGTGRLAVEHDARTARQALETIESLSRGALAEMRQLLTVLRNGDEVGASLAPTPRLGNLDVLVAEVTAAGYELDVQTSGDLDAVPMGVSLTAYRIVQEALTNVVKHAGVARVFVRVVARSGEVTVEVRDDGRTDTGSGPAGARGHGIVGMRERAGLYGGEFEAGPVRGGGWRVWARLPFREAGPTL